MRLTSSPTTRASRFSLSAFSSSSLRASVRSSATRRPSGDQRGVAAPPFSFVSASASPPSMRMRHRFALASLASLSVDRADTKASHWLSGDQAGAVEDLSPRVSWTGLRPSASATQICEIHSLFSPSMAAVPTT